MLQKLFADNQDAMFWLRYWARVITTPGDWWATALQSNWKAAAPGIVVLAVLAAGGTWLAVMLLKVALKALTKAAKSR